ncbi:DHA2 family multidrug resistance protein [Chitinivorax tropicus]|uniref:DHA2 family multidrug resistance protein n=1 Tax=Chitinivorax tropicus TaxID=714531 RepID=A0A840MLI5_9PROT|nr:DHA2 family efflux MFS transporter permease subunit [Chitinivorax tropicus]MBB5017747.1 DHA2 family multidrug resistance protein [Chitinivorax tropicus]
MSPILPGLSRSTTPASIQANRFIIALTVTLASVLELLDTSIVNVAVPHMMGSLGATLDEIAWVSTGYVVANVIVLPISGWLSNQLGRRNYFALSILVFTIASMACGAATSLESMVAWRIVQGIGGGGLIATAQSTLFETFPPKELGTAMAIFGMGIMAGPALGPTVGGWLTDAYSWPWIFYINLPLGIGALLLALIYVPDSAMQKKAARIDYIGLILLAIGIGALQTMLERGEKNDWFESTEVIMLALASFFGLFIFVIHELESKHPIVDLRIMRDGQFNAGLVYAFLTGAALYSTIFMFPIYAQALMGYNAFQTGMFILPSAIATAIALATTSKLVARGVSAKAMIVLGTAVFCYAMWMHYHLTTDSGTEDFFWPLVLRGLGLGMVFVPLNNLAMSNIAPQDMANASGLYNLTRMLGGSVGIATSATSFSHLVQAQQAHLAEHLTNNSIATMQRLSTLKQILIARGVPESMASIKAQAILNVQVQKQANMLSFNQLFFWLGIVLACAMPLLLLMRNTQLRQGAMDAH